MFTPVRRFAHNFPLPLWLGCLWLVVVRLVDPLPRRVARVSARVRSIGPAGVEAASSDDPVVPGRDRIRAGLVALGVAIAGVLLIEYGLAIAANPPGARRIIWVQGRYFLPLVPLTLFGVSGVGRPLAKRWSVLVVVISVVVTSAWIWWASLDAWS
jgi:hypothetical protein